MKIRTIVLATAFALSGTFAYAQSGSNSTGGSSTAGGPAASAPSTGGSSSMNKGMGTTTGSSMGRTNGSRGTGASEQGAPTSAPVNSMGTGTQPGSVKDGNGSRQ